MSCLSEEKCTAVTPETPNCTDTKRDFDAVVFAIFPRYTASFIITMAGHTFPTPAFILLCTCLKKERRGGFTAQKIVARVLGIQHFSIARCYWRSLPRIACSSKSFASLNPEAEICIYVKYKIQFLHEVLSETMRNETSLVKSGRKVTNMRHF